jgi:hypothetical protein
MKFTLATVAFFLVITSALAQSADPAYQPDDGMDMFLMVFALTAVFIMMAISMLGALGFLAIIGVAVGLVFMGVLSVSVLTGIVNRSIASGVKAFLYFGCAVSGAVGGVLFAWVGVTLFHLHMTGVAIIFLGGCSGIAGGIVLAWILIFVLKKMGRYLSKWPYASVPKS